MLSMSREYTQHGERRLNDDEILAGHIEFVLGQLSKWGTVSDDLYLSLRGTLQERGLLPEKPLGTSFYRYVGELVKPLRTGPRETRNFVRDWKGW